MVFQRGFYGFNGYEVPPMPRAARSARMSRVLKRKDNGKGTCAFDVLATVADELLSETKNSSPSSDSSLKNNRTVTAEEDSKEEKDEEDKFVEEKSFHQRNFIYKDLKSYKFNRVQNDDRNRRFGISIPSLDVGSSGVKRYSSYNRSECEGSKKIVRTDALRNRDLYTCHNKDSSCYLGFREPLEGKPSPSVGSFGSVRFPSCKNQTTRDPVPNYRDNIKLHTRDDDDENDYDFFEPRYGNDSFSKPPLRVGDRRLKKIYCNDFPDEKDNKQHSPESCSFKNCKSTMKHELSIKDYPIKKRKLYELSSNKEDFRNDGTDNVTKTKVGDWHLKAASSSQIHASSDHVSFQPRNHQVELRIKSFTVPELRIEIPETASLGCLKRAVMEAVNSELGGGVRVGVLLQGTEIGDDCKSLLQSGISHNSIKDSLEFRLEPSKAPTPVNACGPEGSTRRRFHNSKQPMARYSQTSVVTQKGFHHSHVEGNKRSFDSYTNRVDRPHLATSCSDMVVSDKASTESKAIVPLKTTRQDDADALSLRKAKRSEFAQRRIRRPFTVAEVEALVQAVEELGTGRWRDVKLRAFDHAKHRTYVDLKDKWKTLVHTARISPQQRRGEPVPQELLDRVLVAHAYWSQQQAKQLKSEPDTCLLL